MNISTYISCLSVLSKTLPAGWELTNSQLGWRVARPEGEYYGDHKTPEQAVQAAFEFFVRDHDKRRDEQQSSSLPQERSISLEESPLLCEHANEVPSSCTCGATCYCKSNTCRDRG